jgi:hypothetical protein
VPSVPLRRPGDEALLGQVLGLAEQGYRY